jgi:RNA polymerase sigma-70 factor (ECF subfamily)
MTAPPASELEALRARALAGDAGACRQLMAALAPIIHWRVARVLRRRGIEASRPRVLDLVQELFVVLLDRDARVLRNWNPAAGLSLANFVGLVAEREAHSILRSGRRSAWAEQPTEDAWLCAASAVDPDQPCRTVAARELLGLLLEGLHARLSPRGYAIFEAMFVHDLADDEVMRSFGLSATALYAFRSRVRKTAVELARVLRQDLPAADARPVLRGEVVP